MSYSDSAKLLYEFYKSHGICVRCGQSNAVKGKVMCLPCAEKSADSIRRSLAKKTEEELKQQAAKNRIAKKEWYEKRKRLGICVKCGKDNPGRVYCTECSAKNVVRKPKKIKMRGKCYMCSEPVAKRGDLCSKCYSMVCANLPLKMSERKKA